MVKVAAAGTSSKASLLPALLSEGVLPHSILARHQGFKEDLARKWDAWWKSSPRYARMVKIDPSLPSKKYIKATSNLTTAQAILLTQLRTGHAPLNKHLH